MVAAGDVIRVEGGVDVAFGLLCGELTVLNVYRDGTGRRVCDLGIGSRRVVCGFDLERFIDGQRISGGDQRADDRESGGNERRRSGTDAARGDSDRSSRLRTGAGSDVAVAEPASVSGGNDEESRAVAQQDGTRTSAPLAGPAGNGTPVVSDSSRSGAILAIDLMNVLARSYHAGLKSGVPATVGFFNTVCKLLEATRPAAVVFAAEGGHGHRRELYPDYKSSRGETPDDLREQRALTMKALETIGWQVLSVDGFEADDVLATIAKRSGPRAIIATTDKDLLQLAGRSRVFDPYKRETISPAMVQERFGVGCGQLGDYLALCGDKSDDVPGVPGIGPKKAAALLAEWENLEAVLVASQLRQTGAGKMWANIWQNRELATLSRRLVALVDHLDLPISGLRRFDRLLPGWQDRLRDMELGGVASRIGNAFAKIERDGGIHIVRDSETGSCDGTGSENGVEDVEPEAVAAPQPRSDATGGPDATMGGGSSGVVPLTPETVCSNGLTASTNYQNGRDWIATKPEFEERIRYGQMSATSCWGDKAGSSDWAVIFFRGARGEPLDGSPKPKTAAGGTLF